MKYFQWIVLAVALNLVACGSVNSTSTRLESQAASAQPTKKRVTDVLNTLSIKTREVRLALTPGGVLSAQVDIYNDDIRTRRFAYQFIWLDADGNVIPSQLSTWKTASIPSGGLSTLTAVAPTPQATDFTIDVRRSN